jgi:hypothetical protein
VATVAGTTYTLAFRVGNMDSLQSSAATSLTLQVNDATVGTFTNSDSTSNRNSWKQFTYTFAATSSSTTIAFLNATPWEDNLCGLDDVTLQVAGCR